MTDPVLHFMTCPDARGGHRLAYWQWGESDAPHLILCVHGLTRQGRDFDVLAQALLRQRGTGLRIVCVDVAGRGNSDWLPDPAMYQIPQYAADMVALLAHLQPVTLDWVGTSMGGLIGMAICGQPGLPLPAPVRRLVLNDVGPAMRWEALQRIGAFLGKTGRFASIQEAADAMWAISSSFGPHTPEQWLALSRHMVRPVEGDPGKVQLHYDPAIGDAFRAVTAEAAAQGEAMLWQLYDQITAQTLVLRGAQSDLLSPATAQAMQRRGPCARVVEFDGVGHAPTLVVADQLEAVTSFLLA